MTPHIKPPKKPATLASVVEALEHAPEILGVELAAASMGPGRYIRSRDKWVALADVGKVKLRLLFEQKNFRPVSNRLLNDALLVAKLPALGAL
jgi:hypothetical protein